MPRGKAGTGRPRPIFKGLNVALSGTFHGQWTDTNISRWVNLRAGTFSWRMSEDVTHLVCTKEEFDKKGPRVKEALARAYKKDKKCYLVSLDWLEDSIHETRRLCEDEFSHVATLKALKNKARLEKKIAKGVEEENRAVNQNLYRVYFDPTDFFEYNIILARDGEEMGITGERYVVKLYESNALPHLYHVGVRYYKSKKDTMPKLHRLTETPGDFQREYESFKRFFEIKVGYPWDERLVRGVGSLGAKFFSYQPPTGGKPVGWVPQEYIPKEPTAPHEAEDNTGSESVPSDQPAMTLNSGVTHEEEPTTSAQEGSQDQTHQNDQSQHLEEAQYTDSPHTPQHDRRETSEETTENMLPTQKADSTGENATVTIMPVVDRETQVF
ncbi:hypothetical protein GE21DRAFT_4481 [Neurospora crassa]|uniref:BRCT domain-containing protein n=1 Tax=Neurospora crassa (strain ATCC 24698 / 74-OR23-1A / CBS 708.71 / DSM 1257 / FGSC 987) TaxID=367110 RepID=Q7RXA2_NEUCR|nr:hypothetical protein NCU00185 [Neurospora crassa OR74A]EAA27172.1 hypothetical protein NCU00185 [Neurospora crassa OR74A]KHE89406.1 hypothetical protein GE21DRAFT_4481 [Neurospora crassa]|eukprot:XP_956408.1 hypothetical protein NCU00185 [Neurospora crassa OR74A]